MNKEIMEIIQPYTDKTLSEGCYFGNPHQSKDNPFYIRKFIRNKNYHGRLSIICRFENDWKEIELGFNNFTELDILGHYDITAVLKYITKNKGGFTSDGLDLIIIDEYIAEKSTWNNIGEIPNKPLHLYTEEEQTNLLELLKKLGTN